MIDQRHLDLAHTLVVIGVFTLSAGKRADYIAPAYVSGALVVAWCAGHMGWRLARRKWALVAGLAVITAGTLVVHDRTMGFAVRYPLGDALHAFARQARPIIADARSRGSAVEFYRTGSNPLQTLLHRSQAMANDDLKERLEINGQTWLFANTTSLNEVRAQKWAKAWRFDEQLVSRSAQGNASAQPFQVGLYVVRPLSDDR